MENLFDGIYKGKKVLITGHTGFKGSWLALWLTKLGAEVVGYSKDIPTNPSHFEILNLPIISIEGDILDKEKLSTTIEEHRPDIIFHLAAQALVRKSYIDPVGTFEANILGTINILEVCRKLNCIKAVVNVTSDKCYENKETGTPYIESDPMGGNDPYSASKGCAEIVSQSYRKSFFPIEGYGISHNTLLANARAGNVIGGGDWAEDRLIPDMMKCTSQSEEVSIRNPGSIRPWQHVLDPIQGYLKLGENLLKKEKEFADNWNFGPSEDSTVTVENLVQLAKKYWEEVKHTKKNTAENLHEANTLKLESKKARDLLGWKSVWNIEEAVEKTIKWYKAYYTTQTISTEKDLDEYVIGMKKI